MPCSGHTNIVNTFSVVIRVTCMHDIANNSDLVHPGVGLKTVVKMKYIAPWLVVIYHPTKLPLF